MSNVTLMIGRMPHLTFILMPLLLFSQQGQTPQRDLQITKISASPPILQTGGDAACSTVTVTVSRTAGEPAPMVTVDLAVFAYRSPPKTEMHLSISPDRTIAMLIGGLSQDYRYQVCAPPGTPPGSAVLYTNIYSRPRDWTEKPSSEQPPFKFNNKTYTTADYVLLEVQE